MVENQNIYKDEQNNEIDIFKIYEDYIKEIDDSRSHANVAAASSFFLKTLSKDTLLGVAKLVKLESSPQESRCHAFFRLVGFPVVDKNYRYYNPGHDIIYNNERDISLDYKIDVANNLFDTFQAISKSRETYPNLFKTVFSQEGSITASAVALTSSISRNFNVPMIGEGGPFETTSDEQGYEANLFGYVGKNKHHLTEFQDQNGNTPIQSNLISNRNHYIRPFVVDPRIDFTVYPIRKRVSVPFVNDKSQLKISEGTYVKRPLLEKIIRDRLLLDDNDASIGSANARLKNYILGVDVIKDEPLIKQMTKGVYGNESTSQFIKYLHIIRAMCIELVDAQLTIRRVQSKYYWLPVPSKNGVEDGVKVKNIIISKELNNKFITKSDLQLISATLKKFSNSFNSQTKGTDDRPDNGGFALSSFENTFDAEDTEAMGDSISETVEKLKKSRNKDLRDAGYSLQKIEIIMGDFSGFGFCDIIAIIGALHIMPESDLLGFLDSDAFSRMIISLDKELEGLSNPGIAVAMDSFSARVNDLYNLMDKIYSDIALNNQLV